MQQAVTEGFSSGEGKKAESLADASAACDLHPAAGNIMYCCTEMLEYSAAYRRMRELASTYYSRYVLIFQQLCVLVSLLYLWFSIFFFITMFAFSI